MGAFSFKDHVVKLIKLRNGNVVGEKRLFSGNKAAIELGPKSAVMKGYDLRPYGIIYNSAEPKWNFEGMSAPEVQDSVLFLGGIGGEQFGISVVVQRPGQDTRHISIVRAAIGEGGDWTFDEGSGGTGKLGGPMEDVLVAIGSGRLTSLYAPRIS